MKREVAIIGAGYVGLPLGQVFADAGVGTVLVDFSAERVEAINRGESYIEDVPSEVLKRLVDEGAIGASTDYDAVRECDAIVIALPTPLTASREPDLSIVRAATEKLAERLRPGHLVVLESTTYPGTTREDLLPILATSGLEVGSDFFLTFSPEPDRSGPYRLDDEEHAQGARGHHRCMHEARLRALRSRIRHARARHVTRSGGADEAAREHLPKRQHRASQRTRPSSAHGWISMCGRSSRPPRPSPSGS